VKALMISGGGGAADALMRYSWLAHCSSFAEQGVHTLGAAAGLIFGVSLAAPGQGQVACALPS